MGWMWVFDEVFYVLCSFLTVFYGFFNGFLWFSMDSTLVALLQASAAVRALEW